MTVIKFVYCTMPRPCHHLTSAKLSHFYLRYNHRAGLKSHESDLSILKPNFASRLRDAGHDVE